MEGGTSYFVYLSMIEGLVICCMLGWEIFWLRKMYQVLWAMPTSAQIEKMVKMIEGDRESIKNSLVALVNAFEPLKNMFGSLTSGMLGSLFGGNKTINVGESKKE
jgi:hypothetical protein